MLFRGTVRDFGPHHSNTWVHCSVWILNCSFLFLIPNQKSGLLCQPDPEGPKTSFWPQLSKDPVLGRSWVRIPADREGSSRKRRRHLHRVWSVRLCANSTQQNHQCIRQWRRICKPHLRAARLLMLLLHTQDALNYICNPTCYHKMALFVAIPTMTNFLSRYVPFILSMYTELILLYDV